jgi:MFS family permease
MMGVLETSEDPEKGSIPQESSDQPHSEAKELGKDSNAISTPAPTSPASSTHDPNKRPPCFTNGLQEALFVLTCTMAIGISSFTIGTITVITARIGSDLHMSNAEITWINASCSLAAGSFLMFFARVADLFGRRSMFIVSLGLFSVFVMAAGFSRSPVEMDVLMGLTGLMSAASVPPAQGLLGVIYDRPSKRKNAVFACFSAGNPLGFVFGMISSGVATQILSWRASFWWLAIVYACFTVVAIFTVPSDPTEKQPLTWETVRKFDIPGVLLVVAGIGMFSGALSLGGDAPQGWRTPYVIAVLVLGVACLAVFVVWECYCPQPLVPMGIFRDRNFSLLLSMLLLGFMGFTTVGFWVPLYFQRVWRSSALKTAVYLLPMAIMGTLVNVRVLSYFSHHAAN